MKTTRRDFIRRATVLAGAAAVGMPGIALGKDRGFRESGPTSFRVHLPLKATPFVINGSLICDESKDIFGIRSFGLSGRKVAVETHLSLSRIRQIMRSSGPLNEISAIVFKDGQAHKLSLTAAVEGRKFVLREVGNGHWPFWMQASDVRRIL